MYNLLSTYLCLREVRMIYFVLPSSVLKGRKSCSPFKSPGKKFPGQGTLFLRSLGDELLASGDRSSGAGASNAPAKGRQ